MNHLSEMNRVNKRNIQWVKRVVKIMFFSILPFLLGGCTHDMSRKEIDEIDLVLVLAIDYEDQEYTISALYNSGGGADPEEGSGGSGAEEVGTGTGKTAYEALEDLKFKNKKALSLAQAGSFLIGEGAARQGLDQSLDYLSRDETIKMEALIYVTKGEKAADFIQKGIKNKQTIHEDLEAMKQKQQEIVTRNDNTMVNILNDMRQTDSCVLIPYLLADESGYLIDGYAVFNQLLLVDYLDHETSDGVNFIRNIIRNYPIYLNDEVGLYVSYTNTKLKTKLKNQQVTVTITVSFDSMLKEVLSTRDIFTKEELERLTNDQNNYIKSIIEKPVKYSLEHGLDIFSLARLVENQNFSQWKSIKNSWANEISDIKYQYKVQSRISKSFLLGIEDQRRSFLRKDFFVL